MADYTAKRFDEMASKKGGAFVLARSSLGVTSFGMQILNVPANAGEQYPNHDHLQDGQEEVYVVLGGSGQLAIDGDERIALEPDMAVRVGPAAKRQVFSGDEGLRLLILGGTPGKAYEAPGFTEAPADEPGA
jgi:mannose-6-phosphate isomerase-like protein (cupin superfamily)